MLTDIFAFRYQGAPIWSQYSETERRLLNQSFGIVKDALPYYKSDGKVNKDNEEKWKSLHDRLCRELGVAELSKRSYSYPRKTVHGTHPVSGFFSWDRVCEQFVTSQFTGEVSEDQFIKERISFVELGLRLRGEEIARLNENLPNAILQAKIRHSTPRSGIRIPGSSAVDGVKAWNASANSAYNDLVNELNERFRRAGVPLNYHNGFVQLSQDEKVESQIAKPFWEIVSDPVWVNVDIDMKEALDQRDSKSKDPAIFAAKSLESAIKIISDMKGWTRGNENGAAQYIDNLISKANGSFLVLWEGEMLKDYFRKVRNTVGHGPGSEPMPTLSQEQTDWAIETAMSWVKTLVNRM
jgi:hypothetical protein